MSSQRLNLSTPELRLGDVVDCHGMRCLIDQEPTLSRSHPGDQTYWTRALVLNRDEVPNDLVPVAWTADWKPNAKYEPRPHDGQHRWTIQGNELARWSVTREVPGDELGTDLDIHEDGQTRLGVAGDQLAVLPLPTLETEEL